MGNSPDQVLVFLSEILSAKTLVPIIGALRSDPVLTVRIVNDGFCQEFVSSLGLPVEYILDEFDSQIDDVLRTTSVVLMGKSYVQSAEYSILRSAAHWGVPVLMVVPDMGIDIVRAKLRGIGDNSGTGIPWPTLLLADSRTWCTMSELGVPRNRIVEFGNPYFDELYRDLANDVGRWDQHGVGYFSTPFELDFERGILPAEYRHRDYVRDLRRTCSALGQQLTVKRHPQVEPALFQGLNVFEGTPLQMFRTIKVAVGSYSTTLLEAYVAGVPTISFQPWDASIRHDVFVGRIPIVKTVTDLEELLRLTLLCEFERCVSDPITYNPGSSLERVIPLVKDLASTRA